MSAEAPEGATETVTVTIDGTQLQVPKGTLVIRAAEQLGITIPRFCDHPLLEPVAACRQCIVEVEGQRKPMTACSTTCTDEMVVKTHITSEQAKRDQERMLELLLINHPLDCPQCDKGGECPLQDQALAHGNADSRFVDDKRRYDKAVPISAQVLLDRERCVLCARCTRFSSEISGDPFIELFERGALEQVAIYEDEPYDSYYSGNVVQICPVGALTADSYRFGARPFDLHSTDSVCNQCANGCNQRVDVRRGEIQRQLAQDNMAVNESWSCDKGRFGFEYVASPDRLREPLVRDELGAHKPTSWVGAVRTAARGLKRALDAGGPGSVGVLTGGRLTDEDAYALSRFARDVLGTDNVDSRLRPRTVEERDVLAALAGTVGAAVRRRRARARRRARRSGHRGGGADPPPAAAQGVPPSTTSDWSSSVPSSATSPMSPGAGSPPRWGRRRRSWPSSPRARRPAAPCVHVRTARPRPRRARSPSAVAEAGSDLVVLAGERLALSPGGLRAAAALATGQQGRFAWVPRRTNSRGAIDAGLLPGLLPGGRRLEDPGDVGEIWERLPEAEGCDARGILEAAAEGEITALYLVGVDPARDFEDPGLAERALARVETLVVQDLLPTASTRHADVLLPAQSSQERIGSFTTWEGRRQPFRQALEPQGYAQQDWDIIRQLARALGRDLGWETASDVRAEAAPLMEHRAAGLDELGEAPSTHAPEPRATTEGHELDVVLLPALLGRGDMLLGAKALLETARPATAWLHPDDATAVGAHDGAAVRIDGPSGTLELPVRWTPHIRPGTVVLPQNSTEPLVGALWSGQPAGPRRARLAPVAPTPSPGEEA